MSDGLFSVIWRFFMKLLEERILKDGKIRPGGILKIDSFLNHQIDPSLLMAMAEEFKRLYGESGVNKILTVEASGIAIATMAGYVFGCPLVFAKKSRSRNISEDLWSADVRSFTYGTVNSIVVSKEYLGAGDRVLIIDDFLATGAALNGLISLCEQAGAEIAGAGIAVEKVFQGGGNALREKGMRVESLAMIEAMDDNSITFVHSAQN